MADILRFSADMDEETLIASARLHNRFPLDTAFPDVAQLSDGLDQLCAIIAKYNVHSHFRLRLLHRHMNIPEGQIMFGTSITKQLGFWTRPIRISDIDFSNIHGHIFSVDATKHTTDCETKSGLLFPSEFREGPPISVRNIDSNFFREFTDCLRTKRLESVFGLEVVQNQTGKMIEFSFDIGSLLINEEVVKADFKGEGNGRISLQETVWRVSIENETVCKTGETRCATYEDGHVRFIDTKTMGVLELVDVLRAEGVLAT